jgi:radical SAM superfamily enzyme YgiQ (UPF0313 family)
VRTVFVDNFYYLRTEQGISVEVVPHLGLMTLATILEEAGHSVRIFDPKILFKSGGFQAPDDSFLEAWAEELLASGADVLGFTAYGRTLPYVVRVAQRIKHARPDQIIALGGPHATIVGPALLERFSCFDVVVRYEAEPIIVELVETLRDGGDLSGIANLVFRQGDGIATTPAPLTLPEMDDLPEPALHLYPVEQLRLAELSIEAGRGCPFACTFCSTASFFQRRYRLKSNRRMIEEMERARERYGTNHFNLNHDLFGLVKKSLREFCDLVRGRGFVWKCSMRSDTLDKPLVEQLASAGCHHLYFGIETGSPRLQKIILKKLDLRSTRRMVRWVVEAGIACTVSFIVGFPEETESDQDQTLDLIGELLAIDPRHVLPQLHILSPEPGSELAATTAAVEFDGIGPEADDLLDQDLIRSHPDLFSVFFHYRSVTPRWRQLMTSSFVLYLLPELGYPLATHLCCNFFGGSLAAMFRAIVPEEPCEPLTLEAILRLLHQGTDALIEKLAAEAPYVADLVRFSRIARTVEQMTPPGQLAVEDGAEPAEVGGLARFDCNVAALAQAVLEQPLAAVGMDLAAAEEHWCLLYREGAAGLVVGNLESSMGRTLEQSSSLLEAPLGAAAERCRELGMHFIQL